MATDVDLSWTDTSDNEDGFRIRRSAGATEPADWDVVAELDTVGPDVTTYRDLAVPDGDYYYNVRAFNTAGESTDVGTNIESITLPPSQFLLQDDFTGGDYGPPITGRVPSAFGGTGDNAWQEDADQTNSTQVRSDRLEIIRLGSSITNGAYIDVGQAQWEGEIDWVSTGGPTVEFHCRSTQGVVGLFVDIRLDSDVLRIRDPGVVRSESIAGGVNPDTPYTLRVTNAADSITGTLVDTGTTVTYSTTQDNTVTGAKVRSYLTASGHQLEVTEIRITELP